MRDNAIVDGLRVTFESDPRTSYDLSDLVDPAWWRIFRERVGEHPRVLIGRVKKKQEKGKDRARAWISEPEPGTEVELLEKVVDAWTRENPTH